MLAYGETYRPRLQDKSNPQRAVTLHSSLLMMELIIVAVTTAVRHVDKDVSEASLTFALDI